MTSGQERGTGQCVAWTRSVFCLFRRDCRGLLFLSRSMMDDLVLCPLKLLTATGKRPPWARPGPGCGGLLLPSLGPVGLGVWLEQLNSETTVELLRIVSPTQRWRTSPARRWLFPANADIARVSSSAFQQELLADQARFHRNRFLPLSTGGKAPWNLRSLREWPCLTRQGGSHFTTCPQQ